MWPRVDISDRREAFCGQAVDSILTLLGPKKMQNV